jgi:hypothetical protein
LRCPEMPIKMPEPEPTAKAAVPTPSSPATPGAQGIPTTAAAIPRKLFAWLALSQGHIWRLTVGCIGHLGWSWAVGKDWLIPSSVAVATLFLGAALGGIPALAAGSWQSPQTKAELWATVALGTVGLLALLAAWLIWNGRKSILRRNGTAYIIQETARDWSADDSRAFLAAAKTQFARMIEVPGPARLGRSWDWPLGQGARDWDAKVTDLVGAFRALQYDDDPLTPKGIFMWAWAPVATAFAARVTAADRSLVLDVWQRPSRGRVGGVEMAPWTQRPHRFGRGAPTQQMTGLLSDSTSIEYRWPAQMIIKRPAGAKRRRSADARNVPVILLVRLGRQSWGPVPSAPAEPDPAIPLTVVLEDAAGLRLPGTFLTEIRELRIVPPVDDVLFPWAAYPALVAETADWIKRQATDDGDHPFLLGTIMPPEVALGLGILAAQPAGSMWPTHLWPIVVKPRSNDLVVPRLDLGIAGAFPPAIPS